MQAKIFRYLENFIIFTIILVLIHTLVSDLAILLRWPVFIRYILMFIGFGLDIIFTFEFFVRTIYATSKKNLRSYLIDERGWIDFLASIPILVFSSGPEVFSYIANIGTVVTFGGILQILKVVKAIRIARVLRFLRILKIFCRIKHTESIMAQRHLARISTMVVVSIIFILLGVTVTESFLTIPDEYIIFEEIVKNSLDFVQDLSEAEPDGAFEAIRNYATAIPIILLVRMGDTTLYSRYSNENYNTYWTINDYAYVANENFEVFVDISNLKVANAKENITYFLIILGLIFVLIFLYSPHFALTISDPIHVMRRGIDEPNYNLQVRINKKYATDEVYSLADSYNKTFLPMKDRDSAQENSSILQISAEELANFSDSLSDGYNNSKEKDSE